MRHINILGITVALAALWGCGHRSNGADGGETIPVEKEFVVKNDSMLYGLVCDGTSDSVVVLWPFHGDPVAYSCVEARQDGRIIGKPEIGDWTGVMVNPEDTTEVTMVVDLDQLKGTWTYTVMPVMKDLQNMSKRMQRRMMANVPDSVKETFFVPREYGFTLKRGHKAEAVGRVMRRNTLEDDSPVVYPEVKRYRQWHMSNGRLLLVSGAGTLHDGASQTVSYVVDTLDLVYMDNDSLVLEADGVRCGFHRKQNGMKANEAAERAVERQERMER
ncbi:MAG: hypothetical protein Q4E63_07320 [Prevotellaceae bacterium]|nr:hypothetical protein [Prevotellaceae bacterium]